MNKHLIISLVLLNVTDDMGIILISNIDDFSAYNISCSTILKEFEPTQVCFYDCLCCTTYLFSNTSNRSLQFRQSLLITYL